MAHPRRALLRPARRAPVLLFVVLAGCAATPGDEAPTAGDEREIRLGRLHLPTLGGPAPPAPPPAAELGWRSVSLPDYWPLRRRLRTTQGWYRLDFERPEGPTGPWAALLEGRWSRAELFLNGQSLGEMDAGKIPPAGPSAGAFEPLPSAALHAGTNRLDVRFEASPAQIAAFGPVAVGPSAALRARYERLLLLRTTLPVSFAWFAAACGAITALLARWDATRAAPWFAAATLAWCAPLLEPVRIAFGRFEHGLVLSVLGHGFATLYAIGFHRALALSRPRLEALLLGSIALGGAGRVLVPPVFVPAVDWLWWMPNLVLGIYLLQLARRTARAQALPRSGLVLLAAALALVAALHDAGSLFAGRLLLGTSLFVFAPAALGLATATALASTLGRRLGEARALNVELEQRVEDKRRELQASYSRMSELERGRAIADERERLMRDMHDGTGGQLVSVLSMVEAGDFPRAQLADALRDALTDLRLAIDSLDPGQHELVPLLALARARLEPRLERQGIVFDWQVADVEPALDLGPGPALQVLRIFQEAVTNALKHAGATTLTVRTGTEAGRDGQPRAFVEVRDDGRGFAGPPESAVTPGRRGLRNMRRRAEELGGELLVTSGVGGTSVKLHLPL